MTSPGEHSNANQCECGKHSTIVVVVVLELFADPRDQAVLAVLYQAATDPMSVYLSTLLRELDFRLRGCPTVQLVLMVWTVPLPSSSPGILLSRRVFESHFVDLYFVLVMVRCFDSL